MILNVTSINSCYRLHSKFTIFELKCALQILIHVRLFASFKFLLVSYILSLKKNSFTSIMTSSVSLIGYQKTRFDIEELHVYFYEEHTCSCIADRPAVCCFYCSGLFVMSFGNPILYKICISSDI